MLRYSVSWLLALLAVWQFQYGLGVAQEGTHNLCGQYDSWNSTDPANPYLFINNAWGDDGSGFSCLNVTDDGSAWSLKYKWTGTPTLVKSYSHMKAFPSNLPVQLQNVSHLQLKAKWSTVVDGTQNDDAGEQALALHLNDVWVNVAVDMFFSADAINSTQLNPPIEMMIWPWYSSWVRPLGWQETDPNQHVVMIDGMNFSLYSGYNAGQQHVFSWLAHQNMTSTDADYGPLIKYLYEEKLLPGDLWMGQLEFGTEVLHAAETTIFELSDYKMQLIRQGEKDDYTTTSTVSTSSATATSSNTASTSTSSITSTTQSSSSATSTNGASAFTSKISSSDKSLGLGGILFYVLFACIS